MVHGAVWFRVAKSKVWNSGAGSKRNLIERSSLGNTVMWKMDQLGARDWQVGEAKWAGWEHKNGAELLFAFSGHSHPKSGLDREYQQDFSPVIITVPCSKADLQSLCGRLVPFSCLQNAGSRGDRKHFQVVLPFLLICNERSKYQKNQYKQYKALCVCAACCTQNNASPC